MASKKKKRYKRSVLLYGLTGDGNSKLIGLAELTFRKDTLRVIRLLNIQLSIQDADYSWWQSRVRHKIKIDAVPTHIRESLAYA